MKKPSIPKINSIHFGAEWLATAFLVGGIIPIMIWFLFRVFWWVLCVIGGVILAAFIVVFLIEMHQDFGKTPYYLRNLRETIPFDPEKQEALVRSSICSGEKIAGFKNKADGHFTEVMLISNHEDEIKFMEIYHISSLKKEYS